MSRKPVRGRAWSSVSSPIAATIGPGRMITGAARHGGLGHGVAMALAWHLSPELALYALTLDPDDRGEAVQRADGAAG